jgi:tetratricopeptide (TPR) repeat protein
MKVAILPFNAAPGASAALGRQFSTFACDTIRAATGTEDLHPVSFLTQIQDADGPRAAFVNVADTLLEQQWIDQMFSQSEAEGVMDGMLVQNDGKFELTVRWHKKVEENPVESEVLDFDEAGTFGVLGGLVEKLAAFAGITLPTGDSAPGRDFGTDDPKAFLKFLEGYDAATYISQTNGRVAREFSPDPAIDTLLEACDLDKDFLGPYETLVQLCRSCAQYQLGTFEKIEGALKKLIEIASDDFRAPFALGELYQAVNNNQMAADQYEKAIALAPQESALYSRLGLVQMALGMPVNAERNFRKAVELEPEPKPSLDFVSMVLQATNRQHEIPGLWKERVAANPQDAQSRAKYALSLIQSGNEEAGVRAFEEALELLEDPTLIKRYYAPYLVEHNDLDRAMDFYEDCLDVAPTDIAVLLEYATTLQKANREFEIPKVLRDVLSSNPDPNTRAQALAWLIELEQPRRTEVVDQARQKVEEGDVAGAAAMIKPLKNWLADYWKLWYLLSAVHNRLDEPAEAEEAARRLLELFPGCEPGYHELYSAMDGLGKKEESYQMLRFAATNLPQSLPVHVDLALAAKKSGRSDEASNLARQIREAVGPNDDLERVFAENGL